MAIQLFGGTRRNERDLIDLANERDEITDSDFLIIKNSFMANTGLKKQVADINIQFTEDTGFPGFYDVMTNSIILSSGILEQKAEERFLELYHRCKMLQDNKTDIYKFVRLFQAYYALAHVLIEKNPNTYNANIPRAVNQQLFDLSMDKMSEYKRGIIPFDDNYQSLLTEVFAFNYAMKKAFELMAQTGLEKNKLSAFKCYLQDIIYSRYQNGKSPLELLTEGCYDYEIFARMGKIRYKDKAFAGLPLECDELIKLSKERDAFVKKYYSNF